MNCELRVLINRIKNYSERVGTIGLDEESLEMLYQEAQKGGIVDGLLFWIKNLYQLMIAQEVCNKEMEKKIQEYDPDYRRMVVACKEDQNKIFTQSN